MIRTTLFTMSALVLAVTGCAGTPLPADRLASAQASVRAAEEVGAERTPQAALHLKLAQDGLAQARTLIASADNKRAEWVLLRADADAELALSLARESSARAEAQKTLEALRELERAQ